MHYFFNIYVYIKIWQNMCTLYHKNIYDKKMSFRSQEQNQCLYTPEEMGGKNLKGKKIAKPKEEFTKFQ